MSSTRNSHMGNPGPNYGVGGITSRQPKVEMEGEMPPDSIDRESVLEDAILRALDQIVGWCGDPTTDPIEIIDRMQRILEGALQEVSDGG